MRIYEKLWKFLNARILYLKAFEGLWRDTKSLVTSGTDTGPIILQKAVEVKDDDTPEVLQRRVMEEAEWKILPKAIDMIANGEIEIEGNKVRQVK